MDGSNLVIHRLWIELDASETEAAYLVNAIAYPPSVEISPPTAPTEARFELLPCAEWGLLMQGKRPRKESTPYLMMFSAACDRPHGILRQEGQNNTCTLDKEDLKIISTSAYYLVGNDSQDASVLLGADSPAPSNRWIRLLEGNRFEYSPDLQGQTVKIRVVYPWIVVDSGEPVGLVTVQAIASRGSEFYLMSAMGATLSKDGKKLKAVWQGLELTPLSAPGPITSSGGSDTPGSVSQ